MYEQSFMQRLFYFIVNVMPSFGVTLTLKPCDTFREFNMYPEQLSRVSVMQYAHHHYNRFRTAHEVNQL